MHTFMSKICGCVCSHAHGGILRRRRGSTSRHGAAGDAPFSQSYEPLGLDSLIGWDKATVSSAIGQARLSAVAPAASLPAALLVAGADGATGGH